MEAHIPAVGAWLGSNALALFALATVIGFMLVAAFWYLIIRRLETLVRWLAVVWARVAQYTVVKGLQRSLGGWSWLVVYLTAYVVIAFSAAVIGLVLFVELADEVEAGEDIAAFDDTFTTSLRTSITL